MQEHLITYFDGENAALVLFALATVGAVAAGVSMQARWELRPFAITLAVFALIMLAIGVGLYTRTGPQVDALLAQLASDPTAFSAEEGARMVRVQRTFPIIMWIETALICVMALVAVTQRHRHTVPQVAVGVLINAALLLAFDFVADRRGAIWMTAVETFSRQAR